MSTQLEQIAAKAKTDRTLRFRSLAHLLTPEFLKETWRQMNRRGAGGVDGETTTEFERELETRVQDICARLKAGTYRAPPVRRVDIPKGPGKVGTRPLGIPTVEDRLVQRAVARIVEAVFEADFLDCSYGFRPGRSPHHALRTLRATLVTKKVRHLYEADIRGYFDNLDHELVLRAVRKYTQCPWILLYLKRWLLAPAQLEDGTRVPRTKGPPQGGVVSPLVANMFLHLAFDDWMRRVHPGVPFERYADDIVAHCGTEAQAQQVLESIRHRLAQCRLEVHPAKTRIVYCKDDDRPCRCPQERFDFLGDTFRPRRSKNRWGKYFINFTPAVSADAMTKMRQEMRRWRLHVRSDKAIDDLARMWNPVLRGWIQYYGGFYKSALYPVFRHLNDLLVRWAMRQYKRLRRHHRRATRWLVGVAGREPRLFAHWHLLGLRPGGRMLGAV